MQGVEVGLASSLAGYTAAAVMYNRRVSVLHQKNKTTNVAVYVQSAFKEGLKFNCTQLSFVQCTINYI